MPPSTPACGSGECDLFEPATCDDGDGCLWLLQDGGATQAQCVKVGTAADGEACTTGLDCAPGLDCSAIDAGGSCRRFCCEPNRTTGCPSGQFCRIALVAADAAPEVFLCDACDGCDPSDADACGSGEGCYALPGSETCTVCLAAGDQPLGAACSHAMDCEPGAGCLRVGTSAERRCTAFCNVALSDACTSGSCVETRGSGLPSGVGICLE